MKKLIGRKILKLEEFQTLLTKVKAITNSRPLTYIFKVERVIRPIDFVFSAIENEKLDKD